MHSGSVMVTQEDTKVIDGEFSFYGPMGFDIGAFLANIFLSYFSKKGSEKYSEEYSDWLLDQARIYWNTFT